MVRTQVSLDPAMFRDAQREAKRLGISFAEFCRRALARSLAGRSAGPQGTAAAKPWMRLAGSLQSGDPDASRSIDAIVYGRERP